MSFCVLNIADGSLDVYACVYGVVKHGELIIKMSKYVVCDVVLPEQLI